MITKFTRIDPFHGGGRYHIETSPLICRANQWFGFYMITASVMKELNEYIKPVKFGMFFANFHVLVLKP